MARQPARNTRRQAWTCDRMQALARKGKHFVTFPVLHLLESHTDSGSAGKG